MKNHLSFILLFSIGLLFNCSQIPFPANQVQEDLQLAPILKLHEEASKGILFTATDSVYKTGALYHYSFVKGQIQTILTGLSGDPKIFKLTQTRYVLIDRSGDTHYRFIDRLPSGYFQPASEELPFPNAELGDPQTITSYHGNYLVTLPMSGEVRILNSQFEATSKLDLPKSMYRDALYDSSQDQLFVLQQGLNQFFQVNNQQKLHYTTKAHGKGSIQLTSNTVDTLIPLHGNRLLAFHIATYQNPDAQSGFDIIDRKTMQITQSEILDLPFHGNGGQILAGLNSVYLSVQHMDKRKSVVHYNWLTKKTKEIYNYTENSSGTFLLMNQIPYLVVGDVRDDLGGKLTIYKSKTKLFSVDLDLCPYNGLFTD